MGVGVAGCSKQDIRRRRRNVIAEDQVCRNFTVSGVVVAVERNVAGNNVGREGDISR